MDAVTFVLYPQRAWLNDVVSSQVIVCLSLLPSQSLRWIVLSLHCLCGLGFGKTTWQKQPTICEESYLIYTIALLSAFKLISDNLVKSNYCGELKHWRDQSRSIPHCVWLCSKQKCFPCSISRARKSLRKPAVSDVLLHRGLCIWLSKYFCSSIYLW